MQMVRKALDALVSMDKEAALEVCRSDAEVDALYAIACEGIQRHIQRNPDDVSAGLDMVAVLANLERCADLATNIAEDVVYTVDGHIIRHPGLARRHWPSAARPLYPRERVEAALPRLTKAERSEAALARSRALARANQGVVGR